MIGLFDYFEYEFFLKLMHVECRDKPSLKIEIRNQNDTSYKYKFISELQVETEVNNIKKCLKSKEIFRYSV